MIAQEIHDQTEKKLKENTKNYLNPEILPANYALMKKIAKNDQAT